MSEYTKHLTPRPELRERIIETAVEAFSAHGIKSITMDDIATSLGISKRTLYEVFSDKETLLEECILKGQKEGDEFLRNVLATSENVLEVLLKCYQRSIEQFHATNKKFFEDIKKYPKAYELMTSRHNQDSEETVNFFKEGVKQGIFRDDVNFAIINLLVREQIDVLMNTVQGNHPFLSLTGKNLPENRLSWRCLSGNTEKRQSPEITRQRTIRKRLIAL